MEPSLHGTFATQVMVPVEVRSLKPVDAPSRVQRRTSSSCAYGPTTTRRDQGNRQFTDNGRRRHKKCSLLLTFDSWEQAFGIPRGWDRFAWRPALSRILLSRFPAKVETWHEPFPLQGHVLLFSVWAPGGPLGETLKSGRAGTASSEGTRGSDWAALRSVRHPPQRSLRVTWTSIALRIPRPWLKRPRAQELNHVCATCYGALRGPLSISLA